MLRGRLTRIEREIADLEKKEELIDQDQRRLDSSWNQLSIWKFTVPLSGALDDWIAGSSHK